MTVKIKLLISILAAISLLSVSSFFIYQRVQIIEREVTQAGVAQKIVQVATTRRGLVFDYYRFHEERPKAQWQVLLDAQNKLTQSDIFDTPEEWSVATQINETSEETKSLFAEIVANYEKPKSSEAELALSGELEQVLVTQLLAKVQSNINRAYTLSEGSLARVKMAQSALVFVAGASTAILLLFFVALFFFFNQFVTKPLTKLKEAAMRIASLDFSSTTTTTTTTTGKNSHDEVGQLAGAFNTMAEKLRESYIGLERKVKERTTALDEKVEESEKLNKLMVERELKMIELKKEISELNKKRG